MSGVLGIVRRPGRRGLRRLAYVARTVWRRLTAGQAADGDLIVRRFLDLSTAHLRQRTCAGLGGYDGITAYHTTYGWLMYAPADPADRAEEYGWPDELAPIIALARAHGCDYVLFDADAERTTLLTTFDW